MTNPTEQVYTDIWHDDQRTWFDRVMKEINDFLEYNPELKQKVFQEIRKLTK